MYFLALATDFDGTLAHDGAIDPAALSALARFRKAGGRVLLVTGRELADLGHVVPDLAAFDTIVAENGAVLYDPATGEERPLAPPPPAPLVAELRHRGVRPLAVGRAIIATWEPHEATCLAVIRELGLDMQIAFNKGAVMILPSGISKSSGLAQALAAHGVSAKNVVGVGDAENDHSFLAQCGLSAAVANATPALKASVDLVLAGRNGAGVVELIDRIMGEDARLAPLAHHGLRLGHDSAGRPDYLSPSDGPALILGPSRCGKSTLATSLTERMAEQGLSFCVLDPEGDYVGLRHALTLGGSATPPHLADALAMLREGGTSLVINAQALTLDGRRRSFAQLLAEATQLRERSGRPHWLVIDEAHEVIPPGQSGPAPALPKGAPGLIFISLEAAMLAPAVLRAAGTILALGPRPREILAEVSALSGHPLPAAVPAAEHGAMLCWRIGDEGSVRVLRPIPPHQPHHRHIGKYAAGDLGPWHSFYFRGPEQRINQPARNLYAFIDLAGRVSTEIWLHHLRAGDYAAWFRDVIRDEGLAQEAEAIAAVSGSDAEESRRRISRAIWRRYAAPCGGSLGGGP